ncbi:MAG: hypothetical protein PHR92_04145 [Lachnospiraceae bacterium]|nr:hypothetical protein [Lachnospiraceae bacterium]
MRYFTKALFETEVMKADKSEMKVKAKTVGFMKKEELCSALGI